MSKHASPNPTDGAGPKDQRRFARTQAHLLGRYTFANGSEYPCQTRNLSPGGAALYAPVQGREDERVVLRVDGLGRIDARITRVFQSGFALEFLIAPEQQEALAEAIANLRPGGRRN